MRARGGAGHTWWNNGRFVMVSTVERCMGFNGFSRRQSRIHRMLFRSVTVVGLVLLGTLVLVGCGVQNEGGPGGSSLTAELVVPPDSQTVIEATAVPTSTQVPTATAAVTDEAAEQAVEKQASVNVPNRGYNSLGDPDAPITMFEFSDFV